VKRGFFSKGFASLISLGLVLGTSNNAVANNSSCLSTPTLSSSHQVAQVDLGNGATASAWQWYPGSDASSASLSNLGTKVSLITGNLRNIDFGLLHWELPRTADLRMLSYTSYNALGSINGDYLDVNGPWSAMIEDSNMIYAPTGDSNVIGMVKHKVNPSKGYRSLGYVKFGSKIFRLTGVNQLNPGTNSVVLYKGDFFKDVTPKGSVTIVFRGAKVLKVYPQGYAAKKSAGSVLQIRGLSASAAKLIKAGSKVVLSLPSAPEYETRMAADSVHAYGSISSNTTTLNFDSINYAYLSSNSATLFDSEFKETTKSGRVTLRIQPDSLGNLVIKNVYRQGYFTKVDDSGYIVQANGAAATVALKFKAGDIVTISRSYRSQSGFNFINAGGRGARLIQGGKFVWVCDQHNKDYRPRTAVGWNADGQVFFLTSSRGFDAADMGMRQGGSSTDQMGHWLLNLGATEAFLLDGGGSTTMEINPFNAGWQRFDLPDSAWYRGLSNAYAITVRN
jgi:hypothetical protein